jgi:glycosyltransferase involved in cell wall biosynthesis
MNIVIINDTAHINGGAAKIAITNARDLAARGHRIFYLCATGPIAPELTESSNVSVICSEQYELLADPNRVRAFAQGWWNSKAKRLAIELFSKLNPHDTVVHLHVWGKALSSSVAKAAIDRGFSIVCTLHDFVLVCPTGTLFHHPEQRICRLRPMSVGCICSNCDTRSYPQKLWRVGRQLIQEQFGHIPSGITSFIAHSELTSEIMRPYLPQNSEIHYVPNFIESPKEIPASPADHERFLYLGRLVREKGVLMLAQCALAENAPITFVGSGELATEVLEANPKSVITGWVSRKENSEYLRSCRALVFPSLWYETFGLVVMEAAANGVPSIVPDTSAARELVVDGVTGLYFRGGDAADLRTKMRQLQDPALAARLGQAAYDRFWSSDYASCDVHLDSLEAIYETLLPRIPQDEKYDVSFSETTV